MNLKRKQKKAKGDFNVILRNNIMSLDGVQTLTYEAPGSYINVKRDFDGYISIIWHCKVNERVKPVAFDFPAVKTMTAQGVQNRSADLYGDDDD